MNTFQNPSNFRSKLPRRQWLAGAGLGAAALLLGGCGAAPRRSASAQTRRGSGALRRSSPEIAVLHPLRLDATQREEAVARAMLTVNTPYRYGGNTPEDGFDCSGLVHYVFTSFAGRALPRSARQWAQASLPVDASRLQRGDLVFFNTSGNAFSHMGIYVGNRQFVHAPSSGGTVRIASLDSSYFAARFDGGRTVFG